MRPVLGFEVLQLPQALRIGERDFSAPSYNEGSRLSRHFQYSFPDADTLSGRLIFKT